MADTWVRTYENGLNYIESLGGVSWNDAGIPYPWHRCTAQTRGWISSGYIERCRCGAIRPDSVGPWAEKNQTLRARKKAGIPVRRFEA